jgi:hypothetical protein
VVDKHLVPGGSVVLQLGSTSQANEIGLELPACEGLRVNEVREFHGGVLVRIDRSPV